MKNDIKSHIKDCYDFWFGINNLYEIWAKKQELTSYSLFVLYVIRENEGQCTQKMICDQLLYPKQTVNTILNGFENKGIITRNVMKSDKRNKNVVFTSEGKVYADSILDKLYALEESALFKMESEERTLMCENNHLFLRKLQEVVIEIEESKDKLK